MRVICLHKRIVEYKITKNNRIRQEPAQDTDRIAEIRGIYVNIGSGEVGMPFRIGATPEITVINLWNPTVEKEVVPTEPKR